MKRIYRLFVVVACIAVLASCQSTKSEQYESEAFDTWPIAPGESLIQTEAYGFSPVAETGPKYIEFNLYFAKAHSIKDWTVFITYDGITKKTYSGTYTYLPATLIWDGKDSAGNLAPEGRYRANLVVNYKKPLVKTAAKTTEFILSRTSPIGTISRTPSVFAPGKESETMTITIEAKSTLARIESWTMYIFDPGWNLFRTYSGKWPNNTVAWDGKDMNGDAVVSAEDYPVSVKLRDEFGNTGTIESSLPIDIIVLKDDTGYRIENSRIYFKNYTANYTNIPENLAKQNTERLNRLAEIFKKYPDHKIKIVGHAVKIFWEDPKLGAVEQDQVLIPLSLARAEAIKKAMIERGVNAKMIITEGAGAKDPIVPDSDYPNRWRNRRTSFFIIK